MSYKDVSENDQVLIQAFISNVSMSGVLFTCDLITGAPYYIINYDDSSGQTDSITSGKASDVRTVIAFRRNIEGVLRIDKRLGDIIEAAKEIEQILGYSKFDIEFAIGQNDQIFTFQIHPITVKYDAYQLDEEQFNLLLNSAQQQFKNWQKNHHIF